ncbi:hypothetical protein [Croceimicrobium sp.]|uniref:sulfotransferase-like domain-containing protein n=1 Tax=Croceimicrobium sp. TaxID=2828340 RepID=UPI003BAB7591
MIVALWSGPRNLSTALMYFFAHRGDFQVLDEPFFGAFLKRYSVYRPSRELVLQNIELEPLKVLESLQAKAQKGPLFLKNMANHIDLVPNHAALNWKSILLFRHPAAVIASYRKNMAEISLFDLAYREQWQWLQELQKAGKSYYLLDSDALAQNPERELQKLCEHLQIPFSQSMLQWPAGALKEDGLWAQFWYQRVHQSTGFEAQEKVEIPALSAADEELYQACIYYYELLKKAAHEQIQSP